MLSRSGAVFILTFINLQWFIFTTTLSLQPKSQPIVIITGATGTLGTSLVKQSIARSQLKTLASYRDVSKLECLMDAVSINSNNVHPFQLNIDLKDKSCKRSFITSLIQSIITKLDPNGTTQVNSKFWKIIFSEFMPNAKEATLLNSCTKECSEIILINNAAVCVKEINFDNFITTLFVNTLFPALFVSYLMETIQLEIQFQQHQSQQQQSKSQHHNTQALNQHPNNHQKQQQQPADTNNVINSDTDTRIHNVFNPLAVLATPLLKVINIASGDGELVCLHSTVQHAINGLRTITEWYSYVSQLVHTYDPLLEYAVGDTPYYSLSKALLNAFTRISHNHYNNYIDDDTHTTNSNEVYCSISSATDCTAGSSDIHSTAVSIAVSTNRNIYDDTSTSNSSIRDDELQSSGCDYRVLSVCPGNFESPILSSADRLAAVGASDTHEHMIRTSDDAAKEIFEMLFDDECSECNGNSNECSSDTNELSQHESAAAVAVVAAEGGVMHQHTRAHSHSHAWRYVSGGVYRYKERMAW